MKVEFDEKTSKLYQIHSSVQFHFNFFYLASTCRSSLIIKNQKRKADVEEAIGYFDVMASYLDDLRKIQRDVREIIRYNSQPIHDSRF